KHRQLRGPDWQRYFLPGHQCQRTPGGLSGGRPGGNARHTLRGSLDYAAAQPVLGVSFSSSARAGMAADGLAQQVLGSADTAVEIALTLELDTPRTHPGRRCTSPRVDSRPAAPVGRGPARSRPGSPASRKPTLELS